MVASQPSALRRRIASLSPQRRAALKRSVDRLGSGVLGSINGSASPATFGLTFDDGPDPDTTPRVLDVLRAQDATATFFVLLAQARKHPEVLARAIDEGHEIALHGVDHRRITHRSRSEALAHLRSAKAELEDLTGVAIRLYRPPFGAQKPSTLIAARQAGMRVVVWTCQAEDWIDRDVALVVDSALERLGPGGILLLHDRIEQDLESDITTVTTFDRAELVSGVLHGASARGLRATTVGQLLRAAPERRTVWLQR